MDLMRMLVKAFAALAAVAVVDLSAAQPEKTRPAAALDPKFAIAEAFRTHRLVGIGEPHRNEQAHAMRVALIRDSESANVINDIVVEFGSARYQDVIDRFTRGEQVPSDVLRQVWQNTTQGHTVWDVPIYEEFFRVVREVNGQRAPARQLRVLLGDPPTDWNNVHSWQDVARPMADYNRDRYPAELIRREVLAKNRRALVIYGDGHLWRNAGFPTLVSLLEAEPGVKMYTIASATLADLDLVQQNITSWPVPSIAAVRGTVLGVKDFAHYFPVPSGDSERWRSIRLQDQVDAIAYYGPRNALTRSELSPALCLDPVYMKMRLDRLVWVPPGAPNLGEALKQYCAKVAPK